MAEDKIVAGIDLGTTFSAIAYLDEYGKPNVIPNIDNDRLTPSVVFFDEEEVIVGKIARSSALSDPEHVVQFIKREMGNSDWKREYYSKSYTPESISAIILKKLIQDASDKLGKPIQKVVITVPAYFGDSERKSTQDAGEIAGVEVIGIINEPTAAAISYGLDKLDTNQKVLVYDLGGGTFDVSILEIKDHKICVLATDGEVQLGGKDWDDEIINYVATLFHDEHGIDPRDDLDAYQALRDAAEMAKITLSRKPKARIVSQCQGHSLKIELTREKFKEITQPLLTQTETYLPVVMEKANVNPEEIDTILLVGGSTHMPQVKTMLTSFFKKPPEDSVNADECVALGAAYYSAILQLQKGEDGGLSTQYFTEEVQEALSGLKVINVTAHSLGILVKENGVKKNCILLPAQTPTGYEKTERYGTEADGQTRVRVEIVEGESSDPEECVVIGTCIISGLPPRPAGAPIDVTFKYNEDGRIVVEAVDVETGIKQTTEIVRDAGLSRSEIGQQKDDLSQVTVG